jgi:CBS domain-containing protein
MTSAAEPSAQIQNRSSVPSTQADAQRDYILLDSSDSMSSKWWDMLTAIDTYVNGLKTANVNTNLILATFSGEHPEYVQRDEPISDWEDLMKKNPIFHPGSTPLYDGIAMMARRMRDLDPKKAAITIVTDGEENSSKFTNHPQAKAFLDWCRAKGWQVTFIGCDFDNSRQADLLGGNSQSAIGVARAHLDEAASALAKKRAEYALYGKPMHWSEDEHGQFGGYLAAPDNEDC